jgi:hypothetical protein
VGLKSLKSLNLTNGYPNKNNNNNNNKVKSKPLELFELAGKNLLVLIEMSIRILWNCNELTALALLSADKI